MLAFGSGGFCLGRELSGPLFRLSWRKVGQPRAYDHGCILRRHRGSTFDGPLPVPRAHSGHERGGHLFLPPHSTRIGPQVGCAGYPKALGSAAPSRA